VIGIADTKWGERPLPLVVRKPGSHVAEAEIIELVAARSRSGDISRYAIPERVSFVDAIERTSVGKINKKKLRGLHDPVLAPAGDDASAGTAQPRDAPTLQQLDPALESLQEALQALRVAASKSSASSS
jgi:hypothetical protein